MTKATGIDPSTLLRRAREAAGLSQRELARRAGTAQSVVARIELGESSPTVRTLNRLLEAAGFRPDVSLWASASVDVPSRFRREVPGARDPAGAIRRHFQGHPTPGLVSVYLFGSAARDARHRDSDLDVAVLLDRDVHQERSTRADLRVSLSAELVAATGVNDVDLVILNDLPPGLAARIVLDGVRVVLLDDERDHCFRRDTLLRWGDLQPFLRRMAALKLEALRP